MKGLHSLVLLAAFACFIVRSTGVAAAAEPPGDVPLVSEQVRQFMQDRDWPAAIAAIDEALKAEADAQLARMGILGNVVLPRFIQRCADRA